MIKLLKIDKGWTIPSSTRKKKRVKNKTKTGMGKEGLTIPTTIRKVAKSKKPRKIGEEEYGSSSSSATAAAAAAKNSSPQASGKKPPSIKLILVGNEEFVLIRVPLDKMNRMIEDSGDRKRVSLHILKSKLNDAIHDGEDEDEEGFEYPEFRSPFSPPKDEVDEDDNYCTTCGQAMGACNPRQLCRKTYCENEIETEIAMEEYDEKRNKAKRRWVRENRKKD